MHEIGEEVSVQIWMVPRGCKMWFLNSQAREIAFVERAIKAARTYKHFCGPTSRYSRMVTFHQREKITTSVYSLLNNVYCSFGFNELVGRDFRHSFGPFVLFSDIKLICSCGVHRKSKAIWWSYNKEAKKDALLLFAITNKRTVQVVWIS